MKKTNPEKIKQKLQHGIIGLFMIIVLGFVGCKIYPVLHGPRITIPGLVNGGNVTTPMVHISGIASFTQQLIINGKNLALSPDGIFEEKLILNPGYNVITVQGSDRFGKVTKQTYTMILTESVPTALSMNVVKSSISQP